MDAFLTTYRKDYRWPVLHPLKAGESPNQKILTGCCSEPLSPAFDTPNRQALQISAVPQSENSKLNQPDAFLHQLYDANPYLYSVKNSPVSDDVKKKLLSQRFISTYQNDYGGGSDAIESMRQKDCCCKNNEGEDARFTSNQPITIPGIRAHNINLPAGKGNGKGQGGPPGPSVRLKPRVSEYVDTIGKTGKIVMKHKIFANQPRKYTFTNE